MLLLKTSYPRAGPLWPVLISGLPKVQGAAARAYELAEHVNGDCFLIVVAACIQVVDLSDPRVGSRRWRQLGLQRHGCSLAGLEGYLLPDQELVALVVELELCAPRSFAGVR